MDNLAFTAKNEPNIEEDSDEKVRQSEDEKNENLLENNKLYHLNHLNPVATQVHNNERQSAEESDPRPDLLYYEKTQGVEDHGKEYEKAMCLLYALKLITIDSVHDFSMTTNNKKYGIFDDIELDVTFKNGTRRIFLFQLKYKEDRETINQHMLTKQAQQRDNKQQKSKFFIPNYLEAIYKLDTNGQEFVAVLYTNRPIKIDNAQKLSFKSYSLEVTKTSEVENKDLISNVHIEEPNVFWFTPLCDTAEKEKLEAACQKFFIVSEQDDLETVRADVQEKLKNLLHCDVYSSFEHFMKNWWCDNFVLTKHHVISKLTELALSPYIQTISAKRRNEKTDKLAKAMKKFVLTIVDQSQEDIVRNIWSEICEDEDWKSSPLHKFEVTRSGPSELQRTKILWYWDRVPIIVRMDDKSAKTIESALNLLQRDNRKKSVVLLGNTRNRFEDWDIFYTLFDLEQKHQDIYHDVVCNSYVSLQGKQHISLEQLCKVDEDITRLFLVSHLLEMSQTEWMLIGNDKEELPPLYKSRSLPVYIFHINDILDVSRERSDTLVIICCGDEFKSYLQSQDTNLVELSDYLQRNINTTSEDNIVISTFRSCTSVQFDQLCIISKCPNIYVFQEFDLDCCFLVMMKGNTLRFFRNKNKKYIEEDEIFNYFNNPLNFVCAPPGMGKSLLFKSISNSCSSLFWTIRIELINYNSFLAKDPSFEAMKTRFLSLDKKAENALSTEVKKILLRNEKVVLFLDGLDEVDSRFVNVVVDFAKCVSSEGVRVWISSRENLRPMLTSTLHSKPIEIEDLNEDQQQSYLREKLIPKYQEDEIRKIVKTVYSSADINNSRDLLGIPLQLHMITEMFLNNEEAYTEIDQRNIFVLTHMYKLFFEGKAKTRFEKLGMNESLISQLGIDCEEQLEKYELPGLKSCLDHTDYEKLHLAEDSVWKFLETIKNQGDKLGIIKSVYKTGVIFNHQSYAEYFACVWLRRNRDKIKLLSHRIFSSRYDNLRRIFDIMLGENNPLHLALIYKNVDEFRKDGDLDVLDEGGRTVLHLACSYGAKYSQGLKYDRHDTPRETPFYLEVMDKLAQNMDGDKVDDLFYFNCVSYAVNSRCLFPIEKMLENGLTNFDSLVVELFKVYKVEELIVYCAEFGYPCLFRKLLVKVNPELIDNEGKFLLRIAIQGHKDDEAVKVGNVEVVQALLERGVKLQTSSKNELFELACDGKCYDVLALLVRNGFSGFEDNTMLHCIFRGKILSEEDNDKVMRIAQDLDIDFNAQNVLRKTALHYACKNGNLHVVELLLRNFANPNIADKSGRTSLHYACCSKNQETISLLINRVLEVNHQDVVGTTPLQLACECAGPNIIKLLLEEGADLEIKDTENNNLLHYACRSERSNAETISFLLDLGFGLNSRNANGTAAVHLVSKSGRVDVVKLLLERGADYTVRDKDKKTSLHYACFTDRINIRVIDLLIDVGLKVNARDKAGQSVLHVACQRDCFKNAELLVQRGADSRLMDHQDYTPLDYVRESKMNEPLWRMLWRNGG